LPIQFATGHQAVNDGGSLGSRFTANKYGQMDVAEVRRLRELEKENVRLKRMVAERDL